jgi:hypothetical protein
MLRAVGLVLLVLMGCMILVGCGRTTTAPPLTPEQERELEEQLQRASHAEGAADGEDE